jgi:hypothetical protein
VDVEEVEIHITPNGLGRAAIVRTNMGFLCIYVRWYLAEERQVGYGITNPRKMNWLNYEGPISKLYENAKPSSGLYSNIDDVRREIRGLRGFEGNNTVITNTRT